MPPPTPENAALIFVVFGLLIGAIVGAWAGVIIRLALGLPVLPRQSPRIVPWGGKSVIAVVFAWFAILVAVPVAYHLLEGRVPGGKGPRPPLTPGEMMTLSGLQNFATILLIPALLAVTSGASLSDFGVRLSGFGRQVFRGLVAYPLIAPLIFGVMGISVLFYGRDRHPLESAIQDDKTPGMAFILVMAGVVLAPIAEELIFRGVLLGWLTKVALGVRKPRPGDPFELDEPISSSAYQEPTAEVFDLPETPTELVEDAHAGAAHEPSAGFEPDLSNPYAPPVEVARSSRKFVSLALANVVVSLIFAGLHAAVWPTPIPLFFFSLGLGLLYQQTGSIIGPVVLHMVFNGVSTLIMFLALGATPPVPEKKPEPVNPVPPPIAKLAREGGEAARFSATPRNRQIPRIWA